MGKRNDQAPWLLHAEGRGAPTRGTHPLPGGSQDFSKNQGGPGREESSGKGTRVSVVCQHVDSVTAHTGSGQVRRDAVGPGFGSRGEKASAQHEIFGKCLPEDAF